MAVAALRNIKPAYLAALALIAIQVSTGVLFKIVQTDGKYSFSVPGSVAISEFLKCTLSTFFFWREWRKRQSTPYSRIDETMLEELEEGRESEEYEKPVEELEGRAHDGSWRAFAQAVSDELPTETRFGFANLALFYVLINNTVFVLFMLADPGTIQLIKAGNSFITAVVMILLLKATITSGQWTAIVLQVCGIVVTQYRENSGAVYPLSTYLLLLLQTTTGAVAGVYNQKLCKSSDASMHVMNMSLYSFGSFISFMLWISATIFVPGEPGLFTGYNGIGPLLVILSNIFIGLIMTAVYKYADAIIKGFATAIATAVLLYLSPLLFGTPISFLTGPGTLVVFIATWLYMRATAAEPPKTETSQPMPIEPQSLSLFSRTKASISRALQSVSPGGKYRVFGLTASSIFTIIFLSGIQQWKAALPPKDSPAPKIPSAPAGQPPAPIYSKDSSPFSSTIAHIRIEPNIPQRATLLQQSYAPYFHTTHISMRNQVGSQTNDTAPERDFWYSSHIYSYPPVANTMKLLLESKQAPDAGLLYFDAEDWVSPLQFANMDFERIWHVSKDDAPEHVCVKSAPADVEGVSYDGTQYRRANAANKAVVEGFSGRFDLDASEVCYGRSDMYYIPRRFWQDFIDLSNIFYDSQASSRVTIPTILKILERTHQKESQDPFVSELEDCWIQCCGIRPEIEQILTYRCGRSLDWANQEAIAAHFDRLADDAKSLQHTS